MKVTGLRMLGSQVSPLSAARTAAPAPVQRASSHDRGYNYRWRKLAKDFLRKNPLCVHCEAEGRTEAATQTDHITPHRNNQKLMWDMNNLQPLCATHHAKKTSAEDGGFGNRQR